jgi:putative membrane protein
MTKQWNYSALVLSGLFGWASLAGAATKAQSAKPTAKTKSTPTSLSDSDFAKTAAEGGHAEVILGELAEDRAENKIVKNFGQRMVNDHTKADEQLKTAVADNNMPIPAQMNAKDRAAYSKLSQLSGAAFDRAYARDMVRDHEADIAAFRHEADDGKVPSIKSFAAQTLPTLEDHLKLAREALQTVSTKNGPPPTKKQS